jgi:hypothetical protein
MTMNMPRIRDCTTNICGFNTNNQCRAMAINVGDSDPSRKNAKPFCDAYFESEKKGGADVKSGVDTCKQSNCAFNRESFCTSEGINVAIRGGRAVCSTFKAVSPADLK